VVDPVNHRLLSQERKKHKKEMEEIKKVEYNTRKKGQRLQKKLQESQARIQESTEVVEERCKEWLEGWRTEKAGLKKRIARLDARDRRRSSRTHHAVQKALKRGRDPNATQPVVRYVKDKRGIVQDWARDAILMLVNEGIPMSRTWAVTEANAKVLEVMIVGKWSPRTSRRVVREGCIASQLMIVEYVLTCIGP
jgi:hypothetical protein